MGKRIIFEEICNFRDLDNFNKGDSLYTKSNKIFRSSMLFGPTKKDQQLFDSLSIKSIIDLRSPMEITKLENPYRNHVPYYLPVNLSGKQSNGRLLELAKEHPTDNFMSIRYIEYIENGREEIIRLFQFLLSDKHLPVVIHCSAGKDRTGLIVYLLLSLHQVPLEEILADYQISYTFIKNDERIIKDTNTLNIYDSHPNNLALFHQEFIEQYKSIDNYFLTLGFSNTDIEKLKNIL